MKKLSTILALVLLLMGKQVRADLLRGGPIFEGIRPAGMGNAFLALADDANALFYNPAGLSKIKDVHINLINFNLGFDSQNTLERIRRAVFDSEWSNILRRDMEYMRFGMAPTFLFPFVGLSIFNNMWGHFDMRDLAGRGLAAYGVNDLAAVLGFGLPLTPNFSFGLNIKGIYRSALDVNLAPSELVDFIALDESTFASNMREYFLRQTSLGWGIGFDVGGTLSVPMQGRNSNTLNLAAVVNDLGHTTFRSIGSNSSPPPNNQSYNFGLGMQFPLNFGKTKAVRRGNTSNKGSVFNIAMDYRHAFESVGVHRQLHLGMELRHPVFGVRLGAMQGYPTFGFSIEFPPHTRLHFATYSVELGDHIWDRQQRWYQIQLVIGFNPL